MPGHRGGQRQLLDGQQPVEHVPVVGPELVGDQVELRGERRVGGEDLVGLGHHLQELGVVALPQRDDCRRCREECEDDDGGQRGPPRPAVAPVLA